MGPREAMQLAETHEDLLACVHCGFCLPACPTYDVLGDENDGPRGRIALMRAAAEGRIGTAGAFAEHIGRCLGCLACESACPAGVRYGFLLERARAAGARRSPAARLRSGVERLVLKTLTDGSLSGPSYAVARFARSSGLARFLADHLPGRAGRAAALLVATTPSGTRAGHAGLPAEGGPSFALLEGCVMQGLFGHVHQSARRVLSAWGFAESPAPGQGCCGALHAHAGLLEEARGLARANIEAFERSGVRWIAVDSAGCGAALLAYPSWLEGDETWAERARRMASRVRDVTELVARAAAAGAGGGGRRPDLNPGLRGRAVYDAPCHLLHGQGIREEPLAALRTVPGLEVEVLPSSDRCCGGAGTYNLKRPDLSERILADKVSEIAASAPDWVVTGNPGCIMQIGAGLRTRGLATPVLHPIELLDRALGATLDAEEGGRS